MIFEPILFGMTGAVVKINELDPHVVSIGIGIISAGVIIRILSTIAIAVGDKLNLKEKVCKLSNYFALVSMYVHSSGFCFYVVDGKSNHTGSIGSCFSKTFAGKSKCHR